MTREHPRRRRLQVIRHAPPAEALVAMTEAPTDAFPAVTDDVSRETSSMAPYVAGGQVPEDPPPGLSRAQVIRLEALTAAWSREVRTEVPEDATLLYGTPALPPVPPRAQPVEDPAFTVDEPAITTMARRVRDLDDAGQLPGPARRVSDWSSRHDPRSLEFAVRARLARPVPLQDVLLSGAPVLDQGTTPPLTVREASACVGMAVATAANLLDPSRVVGVDGARQLYARAQQLDHVTGENYAGTSVLAGMKAGQEAGYWDTYLWALGGTRDIAQALLQLRAPVVVGVPWSTGLEYPDADGIIRPTGTPAGGHCLAVVGLRQRAGAQAGPWFVLQQSRGTAEGVGGLVFLHHRDLGRLLAGAGEAAVPLPRDPS